MFILIEDEKKAKNLIEVIESEILKRVEEIEEESDGLVDDPWEYVDIESVIRTTIEKVDPELKLLVKYDTSIDWKCKGIYMAMSLEDYFCDWQGYDDFEYYEEEDDADEKDCGAGIFTIGTYLDAFYEDCLKEWSKFCDPLYDTSFYPIDDPIYEEKFPRWKNYLRYKQLYAEYKKSNNNISFDELIFIELMDEIDDEEPKMIGKAFTSEGKMLKVFPAEMHEYYLKINGEVDVIFNIVDKYLFVCADPNNYIKILRKPELLKNTHQKNKKTHFVFV